MGGLLAWAADYLGGLEVESPRLSAELMLAQVLDCGRLDLYLRHQQPLSQDELAAFKALLVRRRQHEPMAYILGRREFYGLEFKVGPGVLIPRPESEQLVEESLARLQAQPAPRLLELCAGCGAVALALAANLPQAQVVATDSSAQALAYARDNATALGLEDRVQWLQGDLWEPLAPAGGFFDLIAVNPPYVQNDQWDTLPRQVRDFEPAQALLGGDDGLELTRAIIAGAGAFLRAQGWLLVELGQGQDQAARQLAQRTGIFSRIETKPDLAGIMRVLLCQRGDYG